MGTDEIRWVAHVAPHHKNFGGAAPLYPKLIEMTPPPPKKKEKGQRKKIEND